MNEAIQNIAILILVMVVVMITYSFHIDKNAVLKLNFSMEETKCWKGLLALFIVLDHLWMKYNLISLSIFHESAVILVLEKTNWIFIITNDIFGLNNVFMESI